MTFVNATQTPAIDLKSLSWWTRQCLGKTLKLYWERRECCNSSADFSFMTKMIFLFA